MLDFRRTGPGQAAQRSGRKRLALLVFGLGLTVLLIAQVANPQRWAWIDAIGEPRPARNRIDNRAPVMDHPADVLLMPGPKPEEASPPSVAPAGPIPPGELPAVMAPYLDEIRDDTVFREEEDDAWFNLLDVLNRTDEKTLSEKSVGPVTFAQLFQQPKQYRGRLVSTAGIVRRAEFIPKVHRNDAGIESCYRLCFFPNDNPQTPMIVFALNLPQGFPTGLEIEEHVSLVGFFFKRWVYPAKKDLYTTPVLLAKTVDWRPRPVMAPRAGPDGNVLAIGVVVALVVSVALSLFVYRRTRRRPGESYPENITIGEP